MTEPTQQLEQVKQEIQAFIQARPMVVTNRETSEQAKAAMTVVRKEHRARKTWFVDNILCHAEQALKQAKASRDAQKKVMEDLLEPFATWERGTDASILKFETEERQRIKKKEAAELAAYTKRMAKAEAAGKDTDLVKGPVLPAEPAKTAKTAAGAYSVKTYQQVLVYDESQVPEQYFDRIRNDKRIEADLRNNIQVPGAKLEERLGSAIRQ